MSYQMTTLERIAKFLELLNEGIEARTQFLFQALNKFLGIGLIEKEGGNFGLEVEIDDSHIPDFKFDKTLIPSFS